MEIFKLRFHPVLEKTGIPVSLRIRLFLVNLEAFRRILRNVVLEDLDFVSSSWKGYDSYWTGTSDKWSDYRGVQ